MKVSLANTEERHPPLMVSSTENLACASRQSKKCLDDKASSPKSMLAMLGRILQNSPQILSGNGDENLSYS